MKMRSLVFILLFLPVTVLFGQKEYQSKWRNDPSVDVKISDADYSKSNNKGMVLYYISNDSENYYIDLKINETADQNKFLKKGMTIWINIDTKNRKLTGIRFPMGSDFAPRRRDMTNQLNPPSPLSQANTIYLVGVKDVQPVSFPADNTDNIHGKIFYNADGTLLYHLVVPVSRLKEFSPEYSDSQKLTFGFDIATPPEMGQIFGVERRAVEIGSAVSQVPSGSRPSGGSGRPGGSSGRSGSGGGGGMSPGGRGAAPVGEAAAPVIFWVKDIVRAVKN